MYSCGPMGERMKGSGRMAKWKALEYTQHKMEQRGREFGEKIEPFSGSMTRMSMDMKR